MFKGEELFTIAVHIPRLSYRSIYDNIGGKIWGGKGIRKKGTKKRRVSDMHVRVWRAMQAGQRPYQNT